MLRGRNIRFGVLAAVVACLTMAIGASSGQATITYQSTFGGTGTAGGQFSAAGPGGIAVNQTTGHVYAADPAQHRIEEFDADGEFIATFGQGVNETTGGDVCTAASGNTCQAGAAGGAAGAMNAPVGVGVDSSTGAVFVQDVRNNRVDKFTADGQFVLAWGKGVNATTGGNLCSAGETCKKGGISGSRETEPDTPSANGEFAGWDSSGPGLGVDEDGFVYVTDPNAIPYPRVQKFDGNGNFVSQIASSNVNFFDRGLYSARALAVAPNGNTFVLDMNYVKLFHPDDFSEDGRGARYDQVFAEPNSPLEGVRQLAVDPANGYLLVGVQGSAMEPCPGGAPTEYKIVEFHPSGQEVDCTAPTSPL